MNIQKVKTLEEIMGSFPLYEWDFDGFTVNRRANEYAISSNLDINGAKEFLNNKESFCVFWLFGSPHIIWKENGYYNHFCSEGIQYHYSSVVKIFDQGLTFTDYIISEIL